MKIPQMRVTLNGAVWALAAVLSARVAAGAYRHLVEIAPQAASAVGNLFAKPWLDVHIAGAATALLIGPLNLIPAIRQRWPRTHRWIGRVYIIGCLVGAVCGLIVAFGSRAGPIATAGFGSLAVCWLFASMQGWRTAMARRFDEHRRWMIRSFVMTFAAVTIRLYLPLIPLFHVSFVHGYRAISFLAWVPNLILAELYLRGAFGRRHPSAFGGPQTRH